MRISRPRSTTVMLVTVPAALALVLTYSTSPNGLLSIASAAPKATSQEPRQLLDLPKSWVAFEGKLRVFSPDMARTDGRIYRASNGSQRIETGPVGGPIRTIDIRNIAEQTHYLYIRFKTQKVASWSSAPMDVAEWGGYRPMLRFANQLGLRKHPFRLSVRPGEVPNVFAADGFEVYEYHDIGGNTHLQAPELNMFDLVNQSITGRREEVYDVVLREPPAEVFLPPPGVPVEPLTTKRGMVLESRQAHEAAHKRELHGEAQYK